MRHLPKLLAASSLALVFHVCFAEPLAGQISLLSRGNPDGQWRSKQLEVIEQQLADTALTGPLREELEAQQEWLSRWEPGKLGDRPLWEGDAVEPAWEEPLLDPSGRAAPLREKLLGENARPSTADTDHLKALLREHPDDIGLRQLQMHWLDQPQYRKEYTTAIADVALRFVGLAEQMPASEERERALAFARYRRGRALAYRELPEVLAQKPLENPEEHEAQLLGAYRDLKRQVERPRSEFVLLDVRMLRRDSWNGRGLVLLEQYGEQIERRWFLKKRRDILHDLGWTAAAEEAAAVYAEAFPEAVAEEEAKEEEGL